MHLTFTGACLSFGVRHVMLNKCRGFILLAILLVGCGIYLYSNRYPDHRSDPSYSTQTKFILTATALEAFKSVFHRYPTTDEGLDILLNPPEPIRAGYKDGYMLDGWKRKLVYLEPKDGLPGYTLLSLGADGISSEDDISYADY